MDDYLTYLFKLYNLKSVCLRTQLLHENVCYLLWITKKVFKMENLKGYWFEYQCFDIELCINGGGVVVPPAKIMH